MEIKCQIYYETLNSVSIQPEGMERFILPMELDGTPVNKYFETLITTLACRLGIVDYSKIDMLKRGIAKKCRKAYIHREYPDMRC